MTTAAEFAAWIVANEDKKGTPEFERVARAFQQANRPKAVVAPMDVDPTSGMNWFEKGAAGVGKAIVDTGRGLQQLGSYVGIGDKEAIQRDIDASKARDAALMSTGAGATANILGQIGIALAPGGALMRVGGGAAKVGKALTMPQTLAGAAALGAGQGFIQPVGMEDSRALNTGVGAVGGAIAPAVGTLYRTGKALLQPFTEAGREQIAGRTLQRFAHNPGSIDAAVGAPQLVPGSMPTLAEATGDIGFAQLQRLLRNVPDANNALTERLIQNSQARANVVRDIAGDPGKREFFAADRATAAKDLYEKAFQQAPTLTPWVKGQITQLQQRPSFQKAWPAAQELAKEEGIKLDPANVVQVAHYSKLALDDLIESAVTKAPKKAAAMTGTRDKLVSLMESKDFAPAYREARATYAEMSKPINQMDVGQALYEKLVPALADFGPLGRINAANFAQAVRHGDDLAKRATGFGGAKMENIFTPKQMQAVTGVAEDLARQTGAAERGLQPGSATAQHLVGNDMLQQALKGTGIPRALIESGIAETTLGRAGSFAYKPMEAKIMGLLGDAALSPTEAKRLVDLAKKRGMFAGLEPAVPYATQPGIAGGLGLLNLLQQ